MVRWVWDHSSLDLHGILLFCAQFPSSNGGIGMQKYPSGRPYKRPVGRFRPLDRVVDLHGRAAAVVDLDAGVVDADDFVERIDR